MLSPRRRIAAIATALTTAAAVTFGGLGAAGTFSAAPGCPTAGEHHEHVAITASNTRCDVSGDTFDSGLEAGQFHGKTTGLTITGTGVTIHNPTGTPGAPNSRGLSVLPGVTVTLSQTKVSHTLSDGIGVLGGTLTLSDSAQWDSYGGAPDHVDGLQVTSGTVNATRDTFGLDSAGQPFRTGDIQCQGDAGLSICNLTDVTVGGYQGRIAVNYRGGTHGASGSYQRLTIVTAGSTGPHVAVRQAQVNQGAVAIVTSYQPVPQPTSSPTSSANPSPSVAPSPSSSPAVPTCAP